MIAIGASAQGYRKHVSKIELPTMTYVVDNSFGALNVLTEKREVNVKYIQIYKNKIEFRDYQKELWKRVTYAPKETEWVDGWLDVSFYNSVQTTAVYVSLKNKIPSVSLIINEVAEDGKLNTLVDMAFPIDINATVEFMERTQNK